MNTIRKQCHLKAVSENLELGLIGGLLASIFDTVWVICDMYVNGVHIHYIIILSALLLSCVLISVALLRHHKSNVKNNLGALYNFKKHITKCKIRHKREHEVH